MVHVVSYHVMQCNVISCSSSNLAVRDSFVVDVVSYHVMQCNVISCSSSNLAVHDSFVVDDVYYGYALVLESSSIKTTT